jgi:hypothetical protein
VDALGSPPNAVEHFLKRFCIDKADCLIASIHAVFRPLVRVKGHYFRAQILPKGYEAASLTLQVPVENDVPLRLQGFAPKWHRGCYVIWK